MSTLTGLAATGGGTLASPTSLEALGSSDTLLDLVELDLGGGGGGAAFLLLSDVEEDELPLVVKSVISVEAGLLLDFLVFGEAWAKSDVLPFFELLLMEVTIVSAVGVGDNDISMETEPG